MPTPIPKPKKRKVSPAQQEMILDEGKGLSTQKQQYVGLAFPARSAIVRADSRATDVLKRPLSSS
jgi:hypothetical protein